MAAPELSRRKGLAGQEKTGTHELPVAVFNVFLQRYTGEKCVLLSAQHVFNPTRTTPIQSPDLWCGLPARDRADFAADIDNRIVECKSYGIF
jgi:hypothetical protein